MGLVGGLATFFYFTLALRVSTPPPPMSSNVRYFKVWGQVQGVMFRQTVMRAAMKRNLRAAASNLKVPQKDQVEFLLEGDESKMEEILSAMREGKKLNSWGAQVDRLEELAKEDAMQ